MKIFVTDHAVDRFMERVEQLAPNDARLIIAEAVEKTGLAPGLYMPGVEIRCQWGEYKFRAMVQGAPAPHLLPCVTTVLWSSFPGQARYTGRDGYPVMNRGRLPKHLLANLTQESKLAVTKLAGNS